MKTVSAIKVKAVLHELGLRRGRGKGDGHELWIDASGQRRVHPPLRAKDLHVGLIHSLGLDLQAQGICTRQEFRKRLE